MSFLLKCPAQLPKSRVELSFAGEETTSDLLVEWCGQQLPSPVTTTGLFALIRFRTNLNNNQFPGFKIMYRALDSVLGTYIVPAIAALSFVFA